MVASGAIARTQRPSATSATKKVLQPALDSRRVTGSMPQPYASALTPAAHSTGTVVLASFFQLASMDTSSMERAPPTAAGAVAAGGTFARPKSGTGMGIRRCPRLRLVEH